MNTLTKTIGLLVLLVSNPLRAGIIAYTHDPAGRLTAVSYGTNKTIAYTYTAGGDLTQRQFSAGVGGDSDGDGLPDAWELQYFPDLSRNGTGDFDNDGFTDFAEFLLGTSPTDPNSSLRIIPPPLFSGSGVTIVWTAVPGKTYRLQYRTTLGNPFWTDVPGDVTATSTTAQMLDPTATGQSQRYYRVQLATSTSASSLPASSPPPTLSITRTNNQLLISWPSSTPVDFALESATHLVPVVVWTSITNAPSDNGTNKTILLNIEPQTPSRFYRLGR